MNIFGQILFLIGIGMFLYQVYKIRKHSFIEGQVVSFEERSDSEGTTYKPVVQYQDENNLSKTYSASFSSSPKTFGIGDTVKMLYDKNDIEKPIKGILHFSHRFLFAYLLFIIGFSILLFTIGYDNQLRFFQWIKDF